MSLVTCSQCYVSADVWSACSNVPTLLRMSCMYLSPCKMPIRLCSCLTRHFRIMCRRSYRVNKWQLRVFSDSGSCLCGLCCVSQQHLLFCVMQALLKDDHAYTVVIRHLEFRVQALTVWSQSLLVIHLDDENNLACLLAAFPCFISTISSCMTTLLLTRRSMAVWTVMKKAGG